MLIAIEGLPGAGKTTQSRLLTQRLVHQGRPVAYLPDLVTLDTDPLGETLFDLFASSGDPFMRHGDILTETYLAAAIRANIVAAHIQPALSAHKIVIEDRGVHTMYSYSLATLLRHHRTGIDEAVTWLHTLGTMAGRRPDHAVWIRIPVSHAIERAAIRDARTFTPEQQAYLHFVDQAYAELAQRDPHLTVVDAGLLPPDDVHARIFPDVQDWLPPIPPGSMAAPAVSNPHAEL